MLRMQIPLPAFVLLDPTQKIIVHRHACCSPAKDFKPTVYETGLYGYPPAHPQPPAGEPSRKKSVRPLPPFPRTPPRNPRPPQRKPRAPCTAVHTPLSHLPASV